MFQRLILMLAWLASVQTQLLAQGAAFTYQGRLNINGSPATGIYDFRFRLATDAQGNNGYAATALTNSLAVSNGLFTATIDFGAGLFTGSNCWLEVDVKTNGTANYTALVPLQPITATPYALFAGTASNVSGTISATQITDGMILNSVLPKSPKFSGTVGASSFIGNGTMVTNVNAVTLNGLGSADFWKTGGNAGTSPANGDFLGTTDNQPLEVRVNNLRALGLAYASNSVNGQALNFAGGYPGNYISNGVVGATIGGGGTSNQYIYSGGSGIGGGGHFGTNIVTADFGTVVGGAGNIAAGAGATAMGLYSTASGFDSVAMGTATASGYNSMAMGLSSLASGYYSIALGDGCVASNTASVAIGNICTAGGVGAVAMGEVSVATRDGSVALGTYSHATNNGAFVLCDGNSVKFYSTADNQFSARFNGGYRFVTGSSKSVVFSGGAGVNQTVTWTPGSGSWSFSSDRNLKDRFASVDGEEVLKKVAALPISEWSYKGYEQRHLGAMAQDFHALFPLNSDDTVLNDTDLHGVELAAIQGLNRKLEEKVETLEGSLQETRAQNAQLKQSMAELKKLVESLVAKH